MNLSFLTKRPTLQVVGLIILILILYQGVLAELARDWMVDDNYSHGFLIPPISFFFIWRNRSRLRNAKVKPSGMGLAVLALGLLMLVGGSLGAEYMTQRVSLVVVLGGLVLYLWGREVTGAILFPLLFLLFMIPVPYVIYYSASFPLEILASRCATAMVRLLGIPILREGNILYLENTTLQVVDACSGLRSLISLSALSAATAYLTQRTVLSGAILFLTAVPIAIGANVLRLTMTAILASLFGEQVAQGFLHQFSGLVVFGFALICLFMMGGLLRWLFRRENIGSPLACSW